MFPENVRSTLINGESMEYVLFKSAIHFAELGLNIWFISPQPFSQLPDNIHPPEKEVLKLITFLYLKDQKDLLNHLNGIHTWHKMPQVIILTGYSHYCKLSVNEDYDDRQAAFITASLQDAIGTCATKHKDKVYLLVASDVRCKDKINKLQRLSEIYFHNVLSVQNVNDETVNKVIQLLQ